MWISGVPARTKRRICPLVILTLWPRLSCGLLRLSMSNPQVPKDSGGCSHGNVGALLLPARDQLHTRCVLDAWSSFRMPLAVELSGLPVPLQSQSINFKRHRGQGSGYVTESCLYYRITYTLRSPLFSASEIA